MIRNRLFLPTLAILLTLSTVEISSAAPSVNIDCGQLQKLEDSQGKYLLFNPKGKVFFQGNKINYTIYLSYKKKTALSKQSRINRVTTIGGTSTNKIDDFNLEHKFRNNSIDDKYYLSKYLEFTIVTKVSNHASHTTKCIYERG